VAPLFLLLFAWSSAQAIDYSGKVVDPQGLPVAGAGVEIVCEGEAIRTTTSASGQFNLSVGTTHSTCTLSVTREGFARITRPIQPGGAHGIVLELRLAGVTEVVNVVASGPEIKEAIGSVLLEGEQLLQVFNRTEDMIRYAGLLGGSATGAAVYVDGLPATVMPSPELVGQVRVNASPFSAEYGDGDVTRIQISTRAAARRFRLSPGGSFLGFGGGDGLRDNLHSRSSSGSLAVSGPIPRLPATFSATFQSSVYENELALQAVLPTGEAFEAFPIEGSSSGATYASHTRSGTVIGSFSPSTAVRAHVAYSATRATGSNVGVGGLVLPAAGLASVSSADSVQASVSAVRRRLLYEGSFVARNASSSMRANSQARGLTVIGQFVSGGAPIALQTSDRLMWMAKQVTRSSSFHPWAIGVVVGGVSQGYLQTPNPLGSIEFESADAFAASLDGAPTATWLVARGNGSMAYRGLTVAPFVQKTLVRKGRIQVDGGVRADYQSRVGTIVSPRIWAATTWRGVELQAGGGLFVTSAPDQVFVKAILNDGNHLQQYMATGTSWSQVGGDLASQALVRTTIAPSLRPARQVMQRVAVARSVGHLTPSVEYTFTRDTHRLGSDRLPAGIEWVDVIDSNRSASRHRVKTSLRYVWNGQSVTGHYEWFRGFDNGDSPFSYPERQGRLASEWARSAGFAPHSVTVAGSLRLPHGVYAVVTDTWQNGVPYNITTGADADRNGLFNERGGRARNSGMSPAQHLLSVHASRRLQLPGNGWLKDRMRLSVGVHLENILNHRNYTSLGSVVGSPTLGQPLSATSSRSARVSFSFD
jgi:hypothetical protein